MTSHRIGARAEWQAARAALLEREKEHTRMGDDLARLRRCLPWVPVELFNRYMAAFERADMDALVALLRVDATLRMPPNRRSAATFGSHTSSWTPSPKAI